MFFPLMRFFSSVEIHNPKKIRRKSVAQGNVRIHF